MGKTLFLNFKQKSFALRVLLIVQLGKSAGFHLPEPHKLGVAYAPHLPSVPSDWEVESRGQTVVYMRPCFRKGGGGWAVVQIIDG